MRRDPPTLIWNRDFLLLWQGQFVSQLGGQGFTIAMMLWIKQETGSATLMGVLAMAASLPAVFVAPVAGVLSDRFSRRNIIVACDFLGGLLSLILAALMFLHPDRIQLLVVAFVCARVGTGILLAFFGPAVSACVPDLVPASSLSRANALLKGNEQVAGVLGMSVGGILFKVIGGTALIFVDGLSHIVSAVTEMFIRVPDRERPGPPARGGVLAAFWNDAREGFRYVWGRSGVREVFAAVAVLNFFLIPPILLLPFFVEDVLHADATWYGYISAAFFAGSLVGLAVSGWAKLSGGQRGFLLLASLILASALMYLYAYIRTPLIAAVAFGGMAVFASFVSVNIRTVLQLTTPPGLRGRVFGLLGTVGASLMSIAMGLTGVVADLVDQNIPLVFMGSGAMAGLTSIVLSLNGAFRKFVSTDVADAS